MTQGFENVSIFDGKNISAAKFIGAERLQNLRALASGKFRALDIRHLPVQIPGRSHGGVSCSR